MIRLPNPLSTNLCKKVNRSKRLKVLLTSKCLLCGSFAASHPQLLCKDCFKDLPFNRHYCELCALPLGIDHSKQYLYNTTHNQNGSSLCSECIQQPPLFRKALAPFHYGFPITQIIQQSKFHNQKYWLPYLSLVLAKAIDINYDEDSLPQIITPTPMHKVKLKHRGYNQAKVIANTVSKAIELRIDDKLISKISNTKAVSKMNKKERQLLSNGNYGALNIERIKNKRIALVDDVMTTMSTANAISKILLENGALSVDVWTIARTPKPYS